jgi:hypothetical protein
MRNGQGPPSRRRPPSSGPQLRISHLVLIAILCFAALLRFYRLDSQSFWHDEGNSARIAERSIDLIVEGAAGDIHPPGYYLLLHGWRGLFGQSEFALRSLSVVAGILLVLFTYMIGRRLFGQLAALAAAAWSALSPLGVYYSQEARMYALLGALAAGSAYLVYLVLERTRRPAGDRPSSVRVVRLVLYVLVNAAGLYTHYAFAFVVLAHNVVFALWWLVAALRSRPDWRAAGWWAGAQLAAAVLYLPWIPTALRAAGWSSVGGGYRLGPALLDVARVLSVGITQPLSEAGLPIVVTAGLLMAGLWPRESDDGAPKQGLAGSQTGLPPMRQPGEGSDVNRRREAYPRPSVDWDSDLLSSLRKVPIANDTAPSWWSPVSLLVYLLLPLTLFFAFDLYKPAWLKFLVVLLPPVHLLAGRGVANLTAFAFPGPRRVGSQAWSGRRTMALALLVVVGLLVYPSLNNLYFDPAYARDDYRALASDLRAMWRPGDAIVLNAPNQWEVFTYYYPDRHVYPAPYRPRPGRVGSFLSPLVEDYRRLFLLYWGDAESDPHRQIESWLAQHAYKAGDRWYGDVRLATYGLADVSDEARVEEEAAFGGKMVLKGYTLPERTFDPGDVIPLTLFWEPAAPLETSYKVSVQMLDREGELVSQVDTVPRDGLRPTTTWEADEVVADRYGVLVPRGGASGPQRLLVVVYEAFGGERLPVETARPTVGDALVLGEVVVEGDG